MGQSSTTSYASILSRTPILRTPIHLDQRQTHPLSPKPIHYYQPAGQIVTMRLRSSASDGVSALKVELPCKEGEELRYKRGAGASQGRRCNVREEPPYEGSPLQLQFEEVDIFRHVMKEAEK